MGHPYATLLTLNLFLATLTPFVLSDCFVTRDDGKLSGNGTGDAGIDPVRKDPIIQEVQTPDRPSCGGIFFDNHRDTCCNGKVNRFISRQNDPKVKCCGTKAYDSARKICCKEGVPVRGQLKPHMACCGVRLIDANKKICCGGKIFTKRDNIKCCGRDAYIPQNEICCQWSDGRFGARRGNACCNGRAFDNTNPKQSCCEGKLFTQSKLGTNRCCGNRLYNYAKHLCCAGRIQLGRFKPSKFVCCNNSRLSAAKFVACCGKRLYSKTRNQCCDGKIVPK